MMQLSLLLLFVLATQISAYYNLDSIRRDLQACKCSYESCNTDADCCGGTSCGLDPNNPSSKQCIPNDQVGSCKKLTNLCVVDSDCCIAEAICTENPIHPGKLTCALPCSVPDEPTMTPTTSVPTALPTTATPTTSPSLQPTPVPTTSTPTALPTTAWPTFPPTPEPTRHPTTSPTTEAPTASRTIIQFTMEICVGNFKGEINANSRGALEAAVADAAGLRNYVTGEDKLQTINWISTKVNHGNLRRLSVSADICAVLQVNALVADYPTYSERVIVHSITRDLQETLEANPKPNVPSMAPEEHSNYLTQLVHYYSNYYHTNAFLESQVTELVLPADDQFDLTSVSEYGATSLESSDNSDSTATFSRTSITIVALFVTLGALVCCGFACFMVRRNANQKSLEKPKEAHIRQNQKMFPTYTTELETAPVYIFRSSKHPHSSKNARTKKRGKEGIDYGAEVVDVAPIINAVKAKSEYYQRINTKPVEAKLAEETEKKNDVTFDSIVDMQPILTQIYSSLSNIEALGHTLDEQNLVVEKNNHEEIGDI